MGFLNEIKKALFGAKAVTKSAAGKAVKAGKEAGEDLKDKSEEWFEKAKDFGEDMVESASELAGKAKSSAEDFAEKLWDEAEESVGKTKDKVDDFFDKGEEVAIQDTEILESSSFTELEDTPVVEKAPSKLKEAAEKGMDQVKETARKVGDFAGDVGEEVYEKGEALAEKVGEKVEKVGGKVLDAADDIGEVLKEKAGDLFDKAKDAGGKFQDKAESLFEKAQQEAAAEAESIDEIVEKTKKMGEELKQKVQDRASGIKEDDSLLGGTDSFFDRASRFADGDYHNEGAKSRTGDMEIKKDPDYKPKELSEGTVGGFEDLDGDGNEIIDDAIIDED